MAVKYEVSYQPETLKNFALKLERSADGAVVSLGIGTALLGVLVAVIIAQTVRGIEIIPTAALTGGIGLVLGAAVGYSRVLGLRVQAQNILCEVEQEKHLSEIVRLLRKD